MTEPIPDAQEPVNLEGLKHEHYFVARSFAGEFTTAAFKERFHRRFPDREQPSINPADYCVDHGNKGNHGYPRFLECLARTRYLFVGLDGRGDKAHPMTVDGSLATVAIGPERQCPPRVDPPIRDARQHLDRLRAIAGEPERNMEDAVEDLLLRLGHDSNSIVYQVGRIDVAVRDASGRIDMVIEVKRSLMPTSARDDALRKAFDYANRSGAPLVVITDADRFEIYDRTRGLDHAAMLCGRFQLTEFRESDVMTLDLLRPR